MRNLLRLVAALAVACLVALSLARFVQFGGTWPVMMAAFSSYALFGYAVVLIVCALALGSTRHPEMVWFGVVVAAIGIVVHVWWLAPMYAGAKEHRTDLTVMTANLRFGKGDAPTIARTVKAERVDLLVLEEVTPAELRALQAAGLGKALPHQAGTPAITAAGTMVFSRFPLAQARPFELGNGAVDVRVRAPEPFRLLAVHAAQPVVAPDLWLVDMERVRLWASAAVRRGPTLVVGDFNSTNDHAPFRAVLGAGLRDAAEQSGAGWQSTWPTRYRHSWLRALIPIDHVLASDSFTAVRTRTVSVPRSDHLALLAELHVGSTE